MAQNILSVLSLSFVGDIFSSIEDACRSTIELMVRAVRTGNGWIEERLGQRA